jgi:Protein of unknown function (DUF1579)
MGVEFVDPRIFSKVALLWHHEGAQSSTAMNRSIKMPAWRWFATNFLLCLAAVAVPLQGVGAPSDEPSNASVPELIQRMAGNWTVEEWMWTGTGTEPIALPPAVAQRHLIGNEFLDEVMTATPASTQPFTRIAYFDYNAVAQQYEYFSLDTRAAQMMDERSVGAAREGHDPAGAGALWWHIYCPSVGTGQERGIPISDRRGRCCQGSPDGGALFDACFR